MSDNQDAWHLARRLTTILDDACYYARRWDSAKALGDWMEGEMRKIPRELMDRAPPDS
jgi:hypothetical protein